MNFTAGAIPSMPHAVAAHRADDAGDVRAVLRVGTHHVGVAVVALVAFW